jgi:hypothetical protein
MANRREDELKAAAFFMQRAREAMEAAERAASDDAGAAYYQEAETWIYMAARSLNPATPRPAPRAPPPARVARERRSFGSEE